MQITRKASNHILCLGFQNFFYFFLMQRNNEFNFVSDYAVIAQT